MKEIGNGVDVVEMRPPEVGTGKANNGAAKRAARRSDGRGGPRLMGWLLQEAFGRGYGLAGTAGALGVNPAYLRQLRVGRDSGGQMPPDFVRACARFLGVPGIVVKLMAGIVTSDDFAAPHQNPEEALERAMRHMMRDPMVAEYLPDDLRVLSQEAKKALVGMYADFTSTDVFRLAELPATLQLLKRAAACADSNAESVDDGYQV